MVGLAHSPGSKSEKEMINVVWSCHSFEDNFGMKHTFAIFHRFLTVCIIFFAFERSSTFSIEFFFWFFIFFSTFCISWFLIDFRLRIFLFFMTSSWSWQSPAPPPFISSRLFVFFNILLIFGIFYFYFSLVFNFLYFIFIFRIFNLY